MYSDKITTIMVLLVLIFDHFFFFLSMKEDLSHLYSSSLKEKNVIVNASGHKFELY